MTIFQLERMLNWMKELNKNHAQEIVHVQEILKNDIMSGLNFPKACLTMSDRVEIKNELDKGISGTELSVRFNVSTATISRIKSNR